MDLFGWLDGASPWWWVALALVLGAAELLTFSYFLLWIACAALTVALAMFLFDIGGVWQLALFGLCAIAYTAAGFLAFPRMRGEAEAPGLNERSARLIGRQAVVRGPFTAGIGAVEIDGVRWRARLAPGVEPPPEGTVMHVSGAEGMTLVLAPPV